MNTSLTSSISPVAALNQAFLRDFPADAARELETMAPQDSARLLAGQPTANLLSIWGQLPPGLSDSLLLHLPDDSAAQLLTSMEAGQCSTLLSRLTEDRRQAYLGLLDEGVAAELTELLSYPADSADAIMETDIVAFNQNQTVDSALRQLKRQRKKWLHHLYLLNDEQYLQGQVAIQKIALADGDELLSSLAGPLTAVVSALDPRSEVIEKLENHQIDMLRVIDGNDRFVGIIQGKKLLGAMKETLATEMQTMVGVSKDERALSSSWFAVRKRFPWLQINLLTAFLAAAVVGLFESTIA